jgi:Domain of unknown function (DUF4399)
MKLTSAFLFASAVLAACGDVPMQSTTTAAAATPAPATTLKLAAPAAPALPGGYQKVAAPAASSLYFINLKNGDVVASPVLVQFGLSGLGVAPAGVEKAATGHHHLLVDVAELDVNNALPMSDNIRHFGGGQTEARIELKPGVHTLQLLVADHNHIPHHPLVLSERITVTVK